MQSLGAGAMKLDIVGILATVWRTMRFQWRDYVVIAAVPVALNLAFASIFAWQFGEISNPPRAEEIDRIISNYY